MGFDFRNFGGQKLSEAYVEWLVEEYWAGMHPRFCRLWDYYQNPMHDSAGTAMWDGRVNESSRNYVQSQEIGLPPRITGAVYGRADDIFSARAVGDIQRKEIVIENDIAWRINAMVDFLFGKGVTIVSRSPDAAKRREVESILKAVFNANGGAGFFQDMAVLGSVYGFVDCIVRPGRQFHPQAGPAGYGLTSRHISGSPQASTFQAVLQAASTIGLELIEAPRALPVLDENDYRKIVCYVQHFYQKKNDVTSEQGFLGRLFGVGDPDSRRLTAAVTEIVAGDLWQRYENSELVEEGVNPLGYVPVVHIQNLAQPYYYEGISDVEQLIGLQDELNTRLSDRANRITFQTFKMYLAKGLEGFADRAVAPGRMWSTDNPDATIDEFGGDEGSPSENIHISEIREAMDKVSGVTPVVAGVLRNKLGNLTSGVALKMTFMGMLSKTTRKQFTYGEGIKRICGFVLDCLDRYGQYHTEPDERDIEVIFPNPLPEDSIDRLAEAQIKKDIGVPQDRILSELGYDLYPLG